MRRNAEKVNRAAKTARSLQLVLAVGVALSLWACSAGGSSSASGQGQLALGSGGPGGTSAMFTIQIPRATPASRGSRSLRLQYVSPTTQSIAIATNGQAPVVANLTATSPGCVAATSTTPLTCTLAQPATIGADTFGLSLYDRLNGTGNVLSTGTIRQTINAGHSNTVRVTLNGVVSLLQIDFPDQFPQVGTAGTVALDVQVMDADGNIIIAPGRYVNASGNPVAIQLTDSDTSGVTKLQNTRLTGPSSTAPAFSYNGSPLPNGATITVSAPGVSSVNAVFVPRPAGASKIYVTSGNTLTTYNADGSASTPTITGLYGPLGVAVDAAGKIYIASPCGPASCGYGTGSVTTYNADGSASTPTITGLNFPYGVAVDAAGKIYVANGCGPASCIVGTGSVTTYNADGSASVPTISGLSFPQGLAVDAFGKIYVTTVCSTQACGSGESTVTTYNADGSASTPMITGLYDPFGVAIDAAGKIYVADYCDAQSCGQGVSTMTTYNADGSSSTPTITALNGARGVAVDAAGKIYVVSQCTPATCGVGTGSVTTYNADGSPSTPTITGLTFPTGIAVR